MIGEWIGGGIPHLVSSCPRLGLLVKTWSSSIHIHRDTRLTEHWLWKKKKKSSFNGGLCLHELALFFLTFTLASISFPTMWGFVIHLHCGSILDSKLSVAVSVQRCVRLRYSFNTKTMATCPGVPTSHLGETGYSLLWTSTEYWKELKHEFSITFIIFCNNLERNLEHKAVAFK